VYIDAVIQRATKRLLGTAAAAVDKAATLAAGRATARRRRNNPAEALDHRGRMEALNALAALYGDDRIDGFFRQSRRIDPSLSKLRWTADGHQVVDASWASREETFVQDVHARYHRFAENQVAAARLFLGPEPRPVAILIHGYLGGAYKMEQRVWPLAFLNKIGLDVALFVLPFHGVRAAPSRSATPPFPSSDPRITNEGFRQAMADLRDLTQWLRARGHSKVGLMGMSLGGYSASLAATLDPELAFAIPIIPLASVADFARDQGRLGNDTEQTAREHGALEAVHRVVSPLSRKPAIDPRRVLVVGAKADRITPVEHARRLAHHFGAELDTWHGGHLLQVGRSDAFRRIGRFLRELEVTPPRKR
jgi:pimeloyl-ACP methyl ester carboxylesterase